ncbi:TolC family protein [uncultured Paraglaciecola sp.]|uniref:TolC family protein n=1 Tax=uncultured Paraglaciecola sp. TaxID=1765024 RepID=UPI0025FA5432|nr:TolC family protein [uncultured Paraglaciecola sp.]
MKLYLLAIVIINVFISEAVASGHFSEGEISLTDALQAAMEKHYHSESKKQIDSAANSENSGWLANNPSLSFSLLQSQENLGSDEAEIKLNLPLKTIQQRELEQQLIHGQNKSNTYTNTKVALYFSMLIRETLGAYQVDDLLLKKAVHKLSVLNKLEQKFQQRYDSNTVSLYPLLSIKKERLDAEIEKLKSQNKTQNMLERYSELTGLTMLPNKLIEAPYIIDQQAIEKHPSILSLDAAWQQQKKLLKVTDPTLAPWHLSITAKKIDSADFVDNQIGLAVDVPLSFNSNSSQGTHTSYFNALKEYQLARDQTALTIELGLKSALSDLQLLQKQQALLAESLEISRQIKQLTESMSSSNALQHDVLLRRMLEAIDIQSNYALNQIKIQQLNSTLRQIAGIPL